MKPFEKKDYKDDIDSNVLAAVNEALTSDPKLNYFNDAEILEALARHDALKYIELTPANVRAELAKIFKVDFDKDLYNGHAGKVTFVKPESSVEAQPSA